jgi:hypothetical protein
MRAACRALVLLPIAAALSAGRLTAQSGYTMSFDYWFHYYNSDSVVVVREGQSFDLVLVNTYDSRGFGVDSLAMRLSYDPAVLTLVGVTNLCPDSATTLLNVATGSGFVDLSTASCNGAYAGQQIARTTFTLNVGATHGTIIGLSADTLIDNGGVDRTADVMQVALAEVCHASTVWGDVDGNLSVNSRDALVALSSAVGLPTAGFDLSFADVDGDGDVTPRDALLMLSASIGVSTSGYRVAKNAPDHCAPQALLPRALYLSRLGTGYAGQAGISGLTVRALADSSVTIVGDSADTYLGQSYQWRPRINPNGSSVLFVCYNASLYPNICSANADGSAPVRLTTGNTVDQSPDWSPDTTQIVFVRGGQIYRMNRDGSSPTAIPASPTGVTSVAWQPVAGSNRVAYTIGSYGGNAGVHVRSLDTASTDSLRVANLTSSRYNAGMVDWSVRGDSLVFGVYVDGYRAVMVAPNSIGATPRMRMMFQSYTQHPAWTDQGLFFVGYYGQGTPRYRAFLLKPDGTIAPVTRDRFDYFAPGMRRQ